MNNIVNNDNKSLEKILKNMTAEKRIIETSLTIQNEYLNKMPQYKEIMKSHFWQYRYGGFTLSDREKMIENSRILIDKYKDWNYIIHKIFFRWVYQVILCSNQFYVLRPRIRYHLIT